MNALARPGLARADYLEVEESSTGKHDFVDGEILAMAGASPRHNATAGNTIAALRRRLSAGCAVCSSDQRVTVEATGASFYPDAVVVCGAWTLDEDGRGVSNPSLVVEILSPSTEDYDRHEKIPQYRRIPALRDALLLDHRTRTVVHHARGADGAWSEAVRAAGDVLALAVGASIPVDELFAGLADLPGG